MARTGKNQALRRSAPDPVLELNRVDARRFNIQDADFVEIISRRGKVMAQARVTEEITAGTCFLPFHWGRDEGFFQGGQQFDDKRARSSIAATGAEGLRGAREEGSGVPSRRQLTEA